MAITNILPDPTHKINSAGQADAAGTAGKGFSEVKISSLQPNIRFYNNAYRQEKALEHYHTWTIDIAYNPLSCADFHLIYAFINYRVTRLTPFYVSIPPFSSQVLGGITAAESRLADNYHDTILVSGTGVTNGFMFNFANHSKMYKVTRVETENDFVGTTPGVGKERLHFTPGLVTSVGNGTALTFTDPLFKVLPDTIESRYSLNKDGLFELALRLEEIV